MRIAFLRAARLCGAALFLAMAFGVQAEAPLDRLGVPGPVRFAGEDYALAWSSHPQPDFYKQEYVTAGERPQRYTRMFMVDVRAGEPLALMRAMAAMLQSAKARDPVVQYEALASEDGRRGMLDFVLTGADDAGHLIVEWNAYRYEPLDGGRTAILAISRRAYGPDDAKRFLGQGLRAFRATDIRELATMPMPAIVPVDGAAR